MRSTEGLDDNYTRLFLAIFEKAKEDSIHETKRIIYNELRQRGHGKKEIFEFIGNHQKNIETDVQKMVYTEALNYPKTTFSETIWQQNKIRNKYIKLFFS